MCSFRKLLRTFGIIFDIYISWSADYNLKKNWLRKLRTIALPVYFLVLDFDYSV